MGGGSTTTRAELPPELRALYQNISSSLIGEMAGVPLSEFREMPARQYSGLDPLEERAMGSVEGLFQPTQASQMALGGAQRLLQPGQWQGVDLGGQGVGGASFGDLIQAQPAPPPTQPGGGRFTMDNPPRAGDLVGERPAPPRVRDKVTDVRNVRGGR